MQQGIDDDQTAVLFVTPPPAASFGNVDFKVYNIDFENRAVILVSYVGWLSIFVLILSLFKAKFDISQALVTDISFANASFYGCSFSSYQDTWYTGANASTYVVDSIIYGQTDCEIKFHLECPF